MKPRKASLVPRHQLSLSALIDLVALNQHTYVTSLRTSTHSKWIALNQHTYVTSLIKDKYPF